MKKIHIVMQQKDTLKALQSLRELGIVHIESLPPQAGERLQSLSANISQVSRVIALLAEYRSTVTAKIFPKTFKHHGEMREAVTDILRLDSEIQGLKEDIHQRADLIEKWKPWGDFNPGDFELLKSRGVVPKLAVVSVKRLREFDPSVVVNVVGRSQSHARCLAAASADFEVPGEEIAPAEIGLNRMRERQNREQEMIRKFQEKIRSYVPYLGDFRSEILSLQEARRFEEVAEGLGRHEELNISKGYCPQDLEEMFRRHAEEQKWGYLVEDPAPEDQAPTLLRNGRWADLSRPALEMIEILPGYREMDVSAAFMIFFTLFFAMLIGDAAYGVIFALVTFIAQKTIGQTMDDHTPFHLMYLLTACTVVWGVLTGVYFGYQWLPSYIRPLIPWLDDSQNIQWLCFVVALVHLSLARLWAFRVKLPSLTAFAELGWLLIVWGMYFLANMFVLNRPFPELAGWFFMAGIPVALIFMVPFKDFPKEAPQKIIPFALSVISAGTDIISYIRLFAVGLATVAVADAANSMPQALPWGIGYALMIFLHMLNMILAAMAILVHAIRLNVLEFSGHLGLEWAGHQYHPFKNKESQADGGFLKAGV